MNSFRLLCIVITFGVFNFVQAQNKKDPVPLGTIGSFKENITKKIKTTTFKKGEKLILQSKVSQSENVELDIQFNELSKNGFNIIGSISNIPNSTFFIKMHNGNISGNIILKESNKAYEYYSKSDQVFIAEKDINKVICVSLPQVVPDKSEKKSEKAVDYEMKASNNLQSKAGAEACIYLDYDGHYLPAGSRWNKGNPINAAHSGFSDAQIQESWEVVAEDFRPYDINITTNKAVFDSYPAKRRMWCVFTPTNTAAPGAGGVAYMNSFGFLENEVCWVFQGGAKFSGEAASHELGHTLGLGHDGRTNPKEEYFGGHGNWAPIMGVGYGKSISQWSQGEYMNSNNGQNDLSVMSSFIRFRNDDHGNTFNNSTHINKNDSGNISQQYGVIETREDQDVFAFDCGTGHVSLDINTVNRHGDLDIKVNLYEGSSGNLIGVFNGEGLDTHLEAYLDTGRYYIGVGGTGTGNPLTNGYSDYASLGSFWISGTIPPSSGGGNSVATIYEHCPFEGSPIGLSEGSYTMAQLEALGMPNDSLSSLRVQPGYKVTLYWDDHFGGSSLVKTSDDDCLNNDGNWNDKMSSIVVSKTRSNEPSQLIEAENYTSMSGIQKENCSEGGQNVAYIDTGDWMAYANINFPTSDNYLIEYRVASQTGGGILSADINSRATVLGQVNIPNTGGWQNWTTVSHTVNVNAGTHAFGMYAISGGWNINWIKITSLSSGTSFNSTIVQNTTSFEEKAPQVYHTLANDYIHIKGLDQRSIFSLYDLNGEGVLKVQSNSTNITQMDIKSLKPGIYIYKVKVDGKTYSGKLIKQ